MWNSGSNAPTLIRTWEKDSRNFKKLKRKKIAWFHLCLFISKAKMPVQEKKKEMSWVSSHDQSYADPRKYFEKKLYSCQFEAVVILHIKPCNFCLSLLACTWHIDMFYFLHTFLNSDLSNFNWLPTSFTWKIKFHLLFLDSLKPVSATVTAGVISCHGWILKQVTTVGGKAN